MKKNTEGSNRVFYPSKNGPIALAQRNGVPIRSIPSIDPEDSLSERVISECEGKYQNELSMLMGMGFYNVEQGMRLLKKFNGSVERVIDCISNIQQFDGIYIGDRVQRGPNWKWGEQDGRQGMQGTVRGLRQWHPGDDPKETTSVIVLWDMGLYGNYRFGYRGAFDVKVVERSKKIGIPLLKIGDRVARKQGNWRWGKLRVFFFFFRTHPFTAYFF